MDKFNLTQTGQEIQNDLNFIDSEYNKTLNLFNIDNWKRDSGNHKMYVTSIEKNGTYTLSFNQSVNQILIYYTPSGTSIVNVNNVSTVSFNVSLPTNNSVVIYVHRDSSDSNYDHDLSGYDVMLNEGSTALSYQPYSGKLVNSKILEPTTLWYNSSPTSTFAEQEITLSKNAFDYKYFIIEYYLYADSGYKHSRTLHKFCGGGTDAYALTCGSVYTSNSSYITENIGRTFYFVSGSGITYGTKIHFYDCFRRLSSDTGATNNNYMVPIAIYGTNIL